MGFYSPAVLVKDAQRHGLRVLPVDVTKSGWPCTIENGAVRLGLRYARGLRQEAAEDLLKARNERPFSSIDDLAVRVGLRRPEINRLAEIGALNSLGGIHRRDALCGKRSARRCPPGRCSRRWKTRTMLRRFRPWTRKNV